jgi:hypothetical protein
MSNAVAIKNITELLNNKLQGFLSLAKEKGLKLKKSDDIVAFDNYIDDAVHDISDALVKEFPDVATGPKEKKARKPRKAKDPNAPKRACTSFFHFQAEKREEVKAEYPGIKAKDVAKRIGDMWKALDEDEKAPYKELYLADKERYTLAMENYVPSDVSSDESSVTKAKKAKKDKDPNAPKQPKNTFFMFCEEHRQEVKDENKGIAGKDINKLLSSMWKEVDEDTKKEYKEKYDKLKAVYTTAKANYCPTVSSTHATEEKPKKTKAKATKTEKPKNAYQVYCASVRAAVKKANPEASFGELSTILSAEWKALTKEEQDSFKVKKTEEEVEVEDSKEVVEEVEDEEDEEVVEEIVVKKPKVPKVPKVAAKSK